MSQIIRQREVTEIEQKVDEHKSNVNEHSTSTTTTDKHDKHAKTGVLGKIAEVFSTGWMHTDVTGHPYDTRGLYGPTGVKYTPAPGEVLADGTKVKQLDDHSMPSNGVAGAAPVGYTPSGLNQYTTHGSASNLGAATTGAALGAGAIAATHHKQTVVESKPVVVSTPVVASTPIVASTPVVSTTQQSKYIPSGSNGFFAREAFRNDLSKFGSRNRVSVIQKLEDSLHSRRRSNLKEWYLAERTEMQQSKLVNQQPIVQERQAAAMPLQTQAQGEIRVVQLPRTMVTSTFDSNNASTGFAQLATQHAGINVIETHKAPIIDSNAHVIESQQREHIVSGPTIVTSSAMPMQMASSSISSSTHHHMASDLENRMAATSIGSHLHQHNLSNSSSMSTGGQTILAQEQAFQPQLSNQNLAGNNIVLGQTPAGPAGAPYKTGVDSQYVDPNVRSTGDMSKDVTGFPYDTRGLVGPRGVNADIAQAEKDMSSRKL